MITGDADIDHDQVGMPGDAKHEGGRSVDPRVLCTKGISANFISKKLPAIALEKKNWSEKAEARGWGSRRGGRRCSGGAWATVVQHSTPGASDSSPVSWG